MPDRTWSAYLGSFVPNDAKTAFSSMSGKGVFAEEPWASFIDQVFSRLDFSKFPSSIAEIFPLVIPAYLQYKLTKKYSLAELLEFKNRVQKLIETGNDESLDRISREEALRDALLAVIQVGGPHAIKQFQLFSSKDKSDWVMNAINSSRSDLPAVSHEALRSHMVGLLRDAGEVYVADHFDDFVAFEGKPQAGSVGTVAFARYREPVEDCTGGDQSQSQPLSEWRRVVIKMPKPGVGEAIRQDSADMMHAFNSLVQQGKVTDGQAAAFMDFNDQVVEHELTEIDVWRENANLDAIGSAYDGKYLRCVKRVQGVIFDALYDTVVSMDRAPGVGMGSRLELLRQKLRTTHDARQRREVYLEVREMRKAYAEFAQRNTANILDNKGVVHSDPHLGNFNWDYDPVKHTGVAHVFDFGATIDTGTCKESHLQLKRFLFHLNLTVATADASYLRIFYDKYYVNSPASAVVTGPRGGSSVGGIPNEKLDELFSKVEKVLDAAKTSDNGAPFGVSVDNVMRNVIDVMAKEAIDNTQKYGIDLLPMAVIDLARTNTLVAVGLEELSDMLKGSGFEYDIPFAERSQLAISLKASLLGRDNVFQAVSSTTSLRDIVIRGWQLNPLAENYWTKEAWSHFLKNIINSGQLKYEARFLCGVLGIAATGGAEETHFTHEQKEHYSDMDDSSGGETQVVTSAGTSGTVNNITRPFLWWTTRLAMGLAHQLTSTQALSLYEWSHGSLRDSEQMRLFGTLFFDKVDMSRLPKGVSAVVPLVVPEYLKLRIQRHFGNAADAIKFKSNVERLIDAGRDPRVDEMTRNRAHREALRLITQLFGPLAVLHFQLLSSKDRSDWLTEIVRRSRANLAPLVVDDCKKFLIDRFRSSGQHYFADNFDNLINFEEAPRRCFNGDVIFARYRLKPNDNNGWKRAVIKIPRKATADELRKDANDFDRVFESLERSKALPPRQVQYHRCLNRELLEIQLNWLSAKQEIDNISKYGTLFSNSLDVRCCESIQVPAFAALSEDVVFLERAQGKRLCDYVESLQKKISSNVLDSFETKEALAELSRIRSAYADFATLNALNIVDLNLIHCNPHLGNFHWLPHPSKPKLTVYGLRSLEHPAPTAEQHARLIRFFFHLVLAAGTGDANFIRAYYHDLGMSKEGENSAASAQIDALVAKLQARLDRVKANGSRERTVDVDTLVRELVDIIISEESLEAVSPCSASGGQVDLLPTGLVTLARAQTLIADELGTMDAFLHAHGGPLQSLLRRTELGIAFRAVIQGRHARFWSMAAMREAYSRIKGSLLMPLLPQFAVEDTAESGKSLWTKDAWNYGRGRKLVLSELAYSRRFVYGALGLTEWEVWCADTSLAAGIASVCGLTAVGVVRGAAWMRRKMKPVVSPSNVTARVGEQRRMATGPNSGVNFTKRRLHTQCSRHGPGQLLVPSRITVRVRAPNAAIKLMIRFIRWR